MNPKSSDSARGSSGKFSFFRGIGFRVSMGIMLILGILISVSGYLAVQNQRTRMMAQLSNYGNEMASLLAQISAMPIRKFSIYQLEDMAAQVEKGENIAFCEIYDREGVSLVHTVGDDSGRKNHLNELSDILVVEKKIYYGEEILGKVSVGVHSGPLLEEIDRVSIYLSFGIIFQIVFMGIVMNVFLYRIIVSPVIRLSKTTEILAKGKFVTSGIGDRRDEIGGLARSVNHMSHSLREMYRNLENRVAERTEELENANERLKITVDELAIRTREISLFNQMNELLQACPSEEDTYQVIMGITGQMFPEDRGYIAILDLKERKFRVVGKWGYPGGEFPDFEHDGCWASSKGRTHMVTDLGIHLPCRHMKGFPEFGSICEPMVIQGDTVGILHVEFGSGRPHGNSMEKAMEYKRKLAFSLMERYAVFLNSLRLREHLRTQSVRDALTGLYNRRHMEVALKRESSRARRKSTSVGIMMMDVDHFKEFNDTLGHEAGDAALKALGDFLIQKVRMEDVVCRYGGEEFVIILPEMDLMTTWQRAEEIRLALVKDLVVPFGDARHKITVSVGVSAFPGEGDTIEEVLSLADKALYAAKSRGRNIVCMDSLCDNEKS